MVYGGIARLIFSEICRGAFSKRQLKYSLDFKKIVKNVLLFMHLSL